MIEIDNSSSENLNIARGHNMDLSIKILIVDDFSTIRRILKNILKQIGFINIFEADDGTTALEEIRRNGADLIISDWNMPRMTGIELLKAVRSDPELNKIPFLMVISEFQKQNIIEMTKNDQPHYIIKPFTAEQLAENLKKILNL